MSNTEAKAWTSSPGRPGVQAEGCRHAIKIDCGICHAEEFEKDMNKEVEPVKHESSKLEIEIDKVAWAMICERDARIMELEKALRDIDDPCMTVHRAMAIVKEALK